MKYFYKILSGYDDKDPISIDETELPKAIKAQVTGQVAMLKNGTISGNQISKIVPDLDKVEKIYNPSGPDFLPKGVREEHIRVLENAQEIVIAKIENRKPQLKLSEAPLQVHTQGMTSISELLDAKR